MYGFACLCFCVWNCLHVCVRLEIILKREYSLNWLIYSIEFNTFKRKYHFSFSRLLAFLIMIFREFEIDLLLLVYNLPIYTEYILRIYVEFQLMLIYVSMIEIMCLWVCTAVCVCASHEWSCHLCVAVFTDLLPSERWIGNQIGKSCRLIVHFQKKSIVREGHSDSRSDS